MDFAMSVSQLFVILQIRQVHGDKTVFLLLDVEIFDETLLAEAIEGEVLLQVLRFELELIVLDCE